MVVFFLSMPLLRTKSQWFYSSWASISFLVASTKTSLSGWLVVSLKVKVSFPSSVLETRGLWKLGRLSGDEFALFSWRSSLAEKLAVSGRIDLVAVMAIDAKRAMSPNIFGMLLLSCIS